MKRVVAWCLIACLVVVAAGCRSTRKPVTFVPPEPIVAPDVSATAPPAEPPVIAKTESPVITNTTAAGGLGAGRSYTVQKGDTLFALARRFYNGNASKWRVIYEANRSAIPDPNVIKAGQVLTIPPG